MLTPSVPELANNYRLTDTEAEVALALARRMTPWAIARARGVSVYTIQGHIRRAMSKCGVPTQSALVAQVLTRRVAVAS